MVLESATHKGWLLKFGEPVGTAYLEIHGVSHHLNRPYLYIRYKLGWGFSMAHTQIKERKKGDKRQKKDKLFSGYEVDGWIVAGWIGEPVTTNELVAILRSLGFHINGVMSSNVFRVTITKGLVKDFELTTLEKGA